MKIKLFTRKTLVQLNYISIKDSDVAKKQIVCVKYFWNFC